LSERVLLAFFLSCLTILSANAQQTADTPANQSSTAGQAGSPAATSASQTSTSTNPLAPQPLPTPAMTGPLQTAIPHQFDAGPFGQLSATGILSGMGLTQGNWMAGDKATHWEPSNGQVFLQKTTAWWQFYLQAGAYNIPDLGVPFVSTGDTPKNLYGPLPVGYLKLVKGNSSLEVGALPTLMGAEYTFDFENMNIERGLLWNQENAVNRGIQVNQALGKFSLALSWNDGYYSNRYSWLSGSLTYTKGPHSVAFVGMGNLSQTAFQTAATPIQNNSTMYMISYTYTKGNWIVQPYFQYSNVPTNRKVGIQQGASTYGGALLVNHTFKHGFSLAGRGEYITSTGSISNGAVNLLYGPGSNAWSVTLTPTYQNHGFFLRGEFALVQARSFTPGDAFGYRGLNGTQPRGVVEAGFLF
jgi:Putative beta-barrel porin-2, OmpL-like. bbp2